jgi:hypothetical protein
MLGRRPVRTSSWTPCTLHEVSYGSHESLSLYRMSQEGRSICTCVLFRTVSEMEILHCTVHCAGSPLWSRGQSFWLQIQRSGFDSLRYQIFWEVVGLERCPFSLVRIIEELLERKVAHPVYKTEINGRGDSLRWPRDTHYPLKSALTSPTSGGRPVGVVRLRKPRSLFCTLCRRATRHVLTRVAKCIDVGCGIFENVLY